jgi:hypothetical protein
MTGARLLIRSAVPADLDAIARIHTAARSAYYRGSVPDEVLADPATVVSTAQVDVWANNQRARAFYAHHGWRPAADRRPGPAGFDFVRLRLAIPR